MDKNKILKYLFKRKEVIGILNFFENTGFKIFIYSRDFDLYGDFFEDTQLVKNITIIDDIEITIKISSKIKEYECYTQSVLDVIISSLNVSDSLLDIVQTIAKQWKIINFHTKITNSLSFLASVEDTCSLLLKHLLSIIPVTRASILISKGDKFIISASIGLPERIKNLKYLDISGISGWVFNNNKNLIINSDDDLPDELRKILITKASKNHSFKKNFISDPIMIIPLEINGEVLGVLNLTDKFNHTPFNSEDIKIISSISKEISMFIKSIKLIGELKKGEQLKKELSLAAKIQSDTLPDKFPEIKHIDFYGKNIAPNEVGGDYFGYFEDGKYLYVVISDVSGHNFSSALLVNNFRSYLRAFFKSEHELKDLVEEINRFICQEVGDSGRFITSTIVKINTENGDLSYVNSGHNPPFILRRDGSVDYLKVGGMPLGFFEDLDYKEFKTNLKNNDLLILYTDGFEESENSNKEFLGKEKFVKLCKSYESLSAKDIIDNIFRDVLKFTDNKIEDDWTAVGVKYVE